MNNPGYLFFMFDKEREKKRRMCGKDSFGATRDLINRLRQLHRNSNVEFLLLFFSFFSPLLVCISQSWVPYLNIKDLWLNRHSAAIKLVCVVWLRRSGAGVRNVSSAESPLR